jgi:hypothetical protein
MAGCAVDGASVFGVLHEIAETTSARAAASANLRGPDDVIDSSERE